MRVPYKVFSFFLASFLALGLFALPAQAQSTSGEGSDFSAKGVITAPVPVSVFTPMGGQAGDFSWQPGDRAEEGGLAFDILPALVYAPADGVVAGLDPESIGVRAGVSCPVTGNEQNTRAWRAAEIPAAGGTIASSCSMTPGSTKTQGWLASICTLNTLANT